MRRFQVPGVSLAVARLVVVLGAATCACDGSAAFDESDPSTRNLKVSLSSTSAEVAPGEDFHVTLVAENLSDRRALRNIEVMVPLSVGLDAIKWDSDLGRRQELKNAPSNLFAWTLDELGPGARAIHTITLRAKDLPTFVAYNAALAFCQDEDGSLLDNAQISGMPVKLAGAPPPGTSAALRLRASGPGKPVAPGEAFPVRMHIDNLSADAEAHDVLLLGIIDAHLELAGDKSNADRDPNQKRFFSWRTPRIPPLGQAVVEMRMRTKSAADLTDVGTVFTIAFLTGREADPDLTDNWLLLSSPLAAQ